MYVKEVTVENQVGLHARPATFFIQKANEFKSWPQQAGRVWLCRVIRAFDF